MKKTGALCVAFLLLGILTGCQAGGQAGAFSPKVDCIYLTNKGEIDSALVYTSETDNDSYDSEELKAFAQEAADAYNAAHPSEDAKGRVRIAKTGMEGKTGTLVFSYETGEDLVGFASETGDMSHTVTALSVSKTTDGDLAARAGSISFTTPTGKAVTAEEATAKKGAMIALIDGAATVQTEGKISFASEGAEFVDSYTVRLPEGQNCIIYQ